MKYKLTDSYFADSDTYYFKMTGGHLGHKPRTPIGKRAHKTFLKNGGKRDSKGRFSKKQEIDWKKIAEDLYKAYISTPYMLSDYSIENAKVFAEVFKKHNLLREGVEIRRLQT